jgi:hypothetical protein
MVFFLNSSLRIRLLVDYHTPAPNLDHINHIAIQVDANNSNHIALRKLVALNRLATHILIQAPHKVITTLVAILRKAQQVELCKLLLR